MRTRIALAVASLALLAAAHPASAGTQLGLGGDWITEPEAGALQLTLAVDRPLARGVTLGGRFGALIATDEIGPAVPVDLRLRFRVERVYVDGLVGPWFFFDDGEDSVRLHAAIGFGVVQRGGMQVGLEVGYVDPSAMIGIRLAWPF